ncbi:CYT protein, partial [Baryphthengus martii]|nr:CYT protein [Baryphthengus martii]
AVMAGERVSLTLLAVALLFVSAVLGSEYRPLLVGAPLEVSDNANDEGLQRALRFAMTEYNKASNDMYSSRVVRLLSAKKQIVAGIKYIMEVEIGQTTCLKSATNLQNCAFRAEPPTAQHTICKFVVYTVPWLNKTELLDWNCH